MTMATRSISFASSSNLLSFHPSSSTPLQFHIPSHIKVRVGRRGVLLLRLNCSTQSESETTSSAPPVAESSPSVADDGGETGFLGYKLCAALGGIGVLETAYLSYLKFADADAFCPTGGASCNTILTSAYSYVFGVPLPLFGMLAYGLVSFIGFQLGTNRVASNVDKADTEIILVGTTTAMAAASAYFLYILSTEFAGESCLYCLGSATLSFSLFFTTLKNFGAEKIQKMLGAQLCIALLVVIALSASYNTARPVPSSSSDTEIPYFETEVTKESSPLALSLARHLRSIGAKLYGAFWCSHCQDQKQMFGREAAKMLNYIECFPNGAKAGMRMADACYDIELRGFPTWEINGQVLSGEKQLSELATLSGMELEDSSQ